jgi:hypothetical protein
MMIKKENVMKTILKFSFFLASPLLAVVYWRNAMKDMEGMDVSFNLTYNE